MKARIDEFIKGIPYSKYKPRGDKQAADRWTRVVQVATKNLPKAKGRVSMNLKFVLPPNKYPADYPYGPDLDNLLKRLLDALGNTILSKAKSKDGAIVRLTASKREARKLEPTGVRMIINEL